MKREMDFSEGNLRNRWFGVKGIWKEIEGEVKRFVKIGLERALVLEQGRRVGCGRYKRSPRRRGIVRMRDVPGKLAFVTAKRAPTAARHRLSCHPPRLATRNWALATNSRSREPGGRAGSSAGPRGGGPLNRAAIRRPPPRRSLPAPDPWM